MIQPLGYRLLVRVLPKQKDKSGLIIVNPREKEWEREGLWSEVIAVSKKIKTIKKGDLVYHKGHSGINIDKDYFKSDLTHRSLELEDVLAVGSR